MHSDTQLPSARHSGAEGALIAAISLWIAAFAIVVGLVLGGRISTVSYEVYEAAGRAWSNGRPLYEIRSIENFQYFPQAAILMAPFAGLGTAGGGVLWRAISLWLYAFGIWRVARNLEPTRHRECFFFASVLAVMSAIGPLGNGQANLALAGLMLHAVADLNARRFWNAALVLTLGLALKPLMLVLLLLLWALYRPLAWRLPVALGVMLLAPFVLQDTAYATRQYAACLAKLRLAEAPPDLYEDIRGLLATLGFTLPHRLYMELRLGAALFVLWAARRAHARFRAPYSNLVILALASSYLMLFNPRTQSTSYVIPVSVAALLAASYALAREKRAAALTALLCVAWSVNYHVLGFIQYWLKPLVVLVFASLLIQLVFGRSRGGLLPRPE